MMLRTVIAGWVIPLSMLISPAAADERPDTAIVTRDRTPLRAAPRASAQQQALLWQGEMLEIRGERLDYLHVYDYKRERAGFVHASHVRRTKLAAEEAPGLLAVARFLRDTPGAEALGIGLVAAYIHAASPEMLQSEAGIEALDAFGAFADRLAWRASSGMARNKTVEATLSAHLDVAGRYGINFLNHERLGRMHICYDGDAFRRVLGMPSTPEQRARAALALTRHECVSPDLGPAARKGLDEWRTDILDRVDTSALPGYVMNRVQMRRASVWASLAYQRARMGESADAAAIRAITELAGINKSELTEEDLPAYNDAAMRVNASRWAAVPPTPAATGTKRVRIITVAGEPGETCVSLVDAKGGEEKPLATRCTYGIVWTNSATSNREGTALALAVQPMDAWREMWLFRREADGWWTVSVLPPATTSPGIGYAEFAGWVPGGRQMLVAREARGEGEYRRNFEVMRLDTLAVARQAGDPGILGAFQRWQDPSWKEQTLSVR
jgi:hypothetical protein